MGEYPIDQSLRRLVSGLDAAGRATSGKVAGSAAGEFDAGRYRVFLGRRDGPPYREYRTPLVAAYRRGRIGKLERGADRSFARYCQAPIGCMWHGRNSRETDTAVGRVIAALAYAVSDTRGRWLLGPQQDASNELRMTTITKGQTQDLVIDRTFCDANGQRWVVDYKTSSHEGADLEGFLSREKDRYRAQLDRYAELMRRVDNKPVRRGLYFPLLKGWREWGDEG